MCLQKMQGCDDTCASRLLSRYGKSAAQMCNVNLSLSFWWHADVQCGSLFTAKDWQ